jgi:hypothetical protein
LQLLVGEVGFWSTSTVGGGGAIVSQSSRLRTKMPRWVGLVSPNFAPAESTAPWERMPFRPVPA